MSYEKAMRHHRNPRKWKKTQPILCCGYGTPERPGYSPATLARRAVSRWFKERNTDQSPVKRQHYRECIREQIAYVRELEGV